MCVSATNESIIATGVREFTISDSNVTDSVTLEVRGGWCWCETNLLGCGHIIVQSIPAGVYLHGNLTVGRKLLLVHKDGCIIIIDVVLNEEGGEIGNVTFVRSEVLWLHVTAAQLYKYK